MFYPYMTMADDTEVTHTPWDGKHTLVHIETPDKTYCFKTLDFTVPGYSISSVIGFTESEISHWIEYCRNNEILLIGFSMCGGAANA